MTGDVEVLKLPPFLRPKQVREYFGIDRSTLYRWLSNPHSGVKGSKVGKMVLVRTASILRTLQKHSLQGNRNEEPKV